MTLNKQSAIALIKRASKLKNEINSLKAKAKKVEAYYRDTQIGLNKISHIEDYLSPSILQKSLQTLEELDSDKATIPNHYDLAVLVEDLPEVLDKVEYLKRILKDF